MEQLRQLELKVAALEQKVEDKFKAIDEKLDVVLEVAQLGKAALVMARIAGWLIAVVGSAIGIWSYLKGR